ncbi:MAG TPA: ZIP family metal transporter [Bryobacteraceae bacterium]|nr:ZIP family metal transporter [Bryobacteraceae bacterium]
MDDPSFLRSVLAAGLALAFAMAGILFSAGRRARYLVPVSGGLLAAVALFGLLPEVAGDIGWVVPLLIAAAGYVLLEAIDRAGVPVCPSCSHSHGFSGPLVIATAIHSFVDGWGMTATHGAGGALTAVLLIHKIPEGLALGAILRMSAQKPGRAALLAIVAESPTIIGGWIGLRVAQASWLDYPLSLAAGAYLFLGLHAVRAWLRPVHTHHEAHPDHG